MRQAALVAVLLGVVVGCSDRSASPVSPSAVSPTISTTAGQPPVQTVETYVTTSCGFDIRVDLEGKVKEVALPGNRLKVLFPGYSTTLTNVASGKQIALSTTGSFHITEHPTGDVELVYTGRNSYDDPFAGRLLLLIGRFREVFGPNEQQLDGNGQIVDLCQVLS